MRKMKDSGVPWIGEIPEGWGTCKLKFYARICNGSDAKNIIEEDGAYPVMGSGGEFARTNHFQCNKPSVLLGRKGTIDKPLYVDIPFWTIDTMYYTEIFETSNAKFFYYLCKSIPFNMFEYGSAVPSMTQYDLNNIYFTLPSFREQGAIADYLDTQCARIDATIANIRSLIAKLKEYKQSVITEAVTKGLDPDVPMKDSGVPWLQKIPSNWTIRRLKKISPHICVGIVINPTQYISPTGLPYIYGGDIKDGFIDWEHSRRISSKDSDLNAKTKLESGDILTIRVGYPGVSAVVPDECHGGNCASVMLTRKGNFCSNWLCYCMNSKVIKYQISLVKYGAAQEQFNISHAIEFIVPYPSPAEQQRIADYLDTQCANIDSALARQEELLAKLEAYKKSLIYECVTGKREVPASA